MNRIGQNDKFPRDIREIRNRDIAMPRKITLNLAAAELDREFSFAGNFFYVWQAPDVSSYIEVKVNGTNQPAIEFTSQTGLITPFDKLYITTPAGQAGDLVLLIGTEAPNLLDLIDNRSSTVADLGDIVEQLQGDIAPQGFIGVTVGVAAGIVLAANADRKGCIIQAISTNAGNIFLGFTNAVTAGGAPGIWLAELQPGMSFAVDDYRGDIYAIATAAAQVVGVGEW